MKKGTMNSKQNKSRNIGGLGEKRGKVNYIIIVSNNERINKNIEETLHSGINKEKINEHKRSFHKCRHDQDTKIRIHKIRKIIILD